MGQKWIKLGRIFYPDNNYPWMVSHASNPVAEKLDDDCIVYFSSRDKDNRSYICYIIIDIKKPNRIIEISKKPILNLGEIGAFDDNGMSVACILNKGDTKILYYLGWNLGVSVPFRNSIGCAVFNNSTNSFERFSKGPIMDRDIADPFSISYPFVLMDQGIYKMWYGSHKKWGETTSNMVHAIKYAESTDGINWKRKNIICIDTNDEDYAFLKPMVIKESGLYKMWYSYRGGNYRIGYAESTDGLEWIRLDDKVGIDMSENGWDSEMICYPFIFNHGGNRYMLYNGNGYGKTGFGLAVLEKECLQ